MQETISFPTGTVQYLFNSKIDDLKRFAPAVQCVIITDSTMAGLYPELISAYPSIVIPAGEDHKKLKTLNIVTEQLLELQAHRSTLLVGVGGGMVTDMTGFAASVYMRGCRFGFVPTSLLAMVDAAIGGKNGLNFGLQKNLLGTIRQPEFILYDISFLETLPFMEWSNGFAEIIKYGCIFDNELFEILEQGSLEAYKNGATDIHPIIQKCVNWKNKTVLEDEQEKGIRKLLNFGHTVGHAIETLYGLPHGQAISLGMLVACRVSEQITGLKTEVYDRLSTLLQQYRLPASLSLHTDKLMDILVMDKKRNDNEIDFIVLESIGKSGVKRIPFDIIRQAIDNF
ncbi:MAG: 3-dehydroquinate synthase [Bacteroidetes bacterium]|nr:3-dehydroquinate synthase [Bacteroidota bacterium]